MERNFIENLQDLILHKITFAISYIRELQEKKFTQSKVGDQNVCMYEYSYITTCRKAWILTEMYCIFWPTKYLNIHREYQSVCPLVGVGTFPPPFPLANVPLPPEPKGEGHTRLRVRGWGSPNSDDWRKGLALCLLWVLTWVFLLAVVSQSGWNWAGWLVEYLGLKKQRRLSNPSSD